MSWKTYSKEFAYNTKLATPIVLSMLGHTLVGLVDNVMVGELGAAELAAASLATSFVFIAVSFVMGFSSAITPMVAAADASENIEEGKKTLFNGLVLCTLLGVFIFAVLYAVKPYLSHMKQPEDVVILAGPFLDVVAFSMIPLCTFQALKQFTDGKSQTKYSMYASLLSNVVNVVFNYVLIHGIWFFPKMGLMGAAYGTLIARIVMLIYMIYIMMQNPKFRVFIEKWSLHLWDKFFVKKISKVGIPSGMQTIFEAGLFVGAVWLSGALGTVEQAANQITLSMASSTFMFASGLSVAGMIRVGNMMGIKDYKRLRTIAQSILIMTIILFTGFALFFIVFKNYIPYVFIENDSLINKEVIETSAKLLLIAGLFQIVDGIQIVMLGSLRGMQDVNIPMTFTFISYWVVGFGLCIYLAFYTPLGAEGIWYGLLAGLTCSSILSFLRFEYVSKKLINSTN